MSRNENGPQSLCGGIDMNKICQEQDKLVTSGVLLGTHATPWPLGSAPGWLHSVPLSGICLAWENAAVMSPEAPRTVCRSILYKDTLVFLVSVSQTKSGI